MAQVTLKVVNRTPKRPIKGLPNSIEITEKTTVQDVKLQVARPGRWDPERMGLFDTEQKKLLKNSKQLITSVPEIMSAKEIMVKDLGPQLSWTTVFVLEYLGPILIHLLFLVIRPYIYSSYEPLSTSQTLAMWMIVLHFLKREYETFFVHKFSLATMPARNIFKNCGHYWALAGVNVAYWVYSPTATAAKSSPLINNINIVGVLIYLFGEFSNLHTHITLSNLRAPGSTERGIPKGYGFDVVTCPNYLFELVAWTGIAIVCKSWSNLLFNVVAWWIMNQWAIKKERALRKEFPDKYQKKKYVLIPGPAAAVKLFTG